MTPRRIQKPMPLRGRRSAFPADAIGDEFSPNALNVRFRFGEARGGPGRALFDDGPTNQKALWIGNFSRSDDVIWPVMFTENKLFRRGFGTPGDVNAWLEVTGTFVPLIDNRRMGVAVGEDRLFFSRGNEEIASWGGNSAVPFDLISNEPGFEGIGNTTNGIAARYLEYWNNRVIAGYTVEAGVNPTKANRLRWSQSGDFRKWDETLGLGAGFLDLNSEGAEAISGIKTLGDNLVVYRKHSVTEIVKTGTLAPTHREIV